MLAFALDKPEGLTSQQALSALKRKFRLYKLGHTGTLDPFATGVLPVFIGEGTKLIPYLDDSRKTYVARLKLGARTDTQDATGQIVETRPLPLLENPVIEAALAEFLGEQLQTPPQYSAIKVRGKPMYEYARAGQEVKLEPRKIRVDSLRLLEWAGDEIQFEASVSRGTYIRSLGESIAERLGSIGHLTALRRTRSGFFEIGESLALDEVLRLESLAPLRERFPLRRLFPEMPHLMLQDPAEETLLRRGQRIALEGLAELRGEAGERAWIYFDGAPCCLAEVCSGEGCRLFLRPLRVFAKEGSHYA